MEKLGRNPPHFGWKLYFALVLALTAFGMAELRWDGLELLNFAVGLVGLVGLLGFAWALRMPGPPRFWSSVGVLMAALAAINVAVMVWRGRGEINEQPFVVIAAVAIALALMVPNAVALLRYGRDLKSAAAG